jgi:drug/metabolite transporter (DMT)-like permease
MPNRVWLPYLVLLVGVIIAATSSILIRYAQAEGVPSLTIATGRLALAALILAPLAWVRVAGELRALQRRDVLLGVASGGFLAAHLATWISSLAYTSVASSAALVTTNPIWVGLASWLILNERPGWRTISGIVLTLLGSAGIILSGMGAQASAQFANPLLGNILALIGALTVSGYFLIGRGLRRRLSTLAYIWLVYSSAAGVLLLFAALLGVPLLGFSPLAYLLVLAIAVGPQLLAHTSFNWALAHLSATFVALAILGEPVGAAILAWFLFQEQIDPTTREGLLQLGGFVLLLVGIYVAATGERRATPAAVEQGAPGQS